MMPRKYTWRCLTCRREKKACDGERPTCGNCREGWLGCEWPGKSVRSRSAPEPQSVSQPDRQDDPGALPPNNFVFVQEFPDFPYPKEVESESENTRSTTALPDGPPQSQSAPLYRPPPVQSIEKRKMLAGNMYNQGDPQLVFERDKCREALMHFNTTFSCVERTKIANRVFGSIGRNVQIESPFYCEYGYTINLGDDTTIGPNCVIVDPTQINIGPRCCLGPNVCIGAKEISPNPNDRAGIFTIAYSGGVWIEDRVSIEAGAIICNGARIGRGSTVAAGAVVKGHIPAFSYVRRYPVESYRH